MNPDPDQPAPLQAARRQFLQQHAYNNKSEQDLLDEQRRILREAIAGGRGAFALVPGDEIAQLKSRLGKDFAVHAVTSWKEPALIPEVERPPTGAGLAPAPGPAPPRGPPQGDLRGRRAPGLPLRGAPQRWQIVQITAK
jgi:hypothetical protein